MFVIVHLVLMTLVLKHALDPTVQEGSHLQEDRVIAKVILFVLHAQSTHQKMSVNREWEVNT